MNGGRQQPLGVDGDAARGNGNRPAGLDSAMRTSQITTSRPPTVPVPSICELRMPSLLAAVYESISDCVVRLKPNWSMDRSEFGPGPPAVQMNRPARARNAPGRLV